MPTPAPERLACLEIRGGNDHATYAAELPGLEAWISCRPLRPSAKGGDFYYLSVCSGGVISRIVVADVAGHGEAVSLAADRLKDAMRLHADNWDQSVLIRLLNDTFLKGASGDAIEYATAFLVSYYGETGELLFTNAGHPLPLWFHAATAEWSYLREESPWVRDITDLPLGLIPGTQYTQTCVALGSGDLMLLYTDGVLESVDPSGEQLGQKRLLELARALPFVSAAEAGQALLLAVEAWRGGGPSAGDDETVVALQRAEMPGSWG